MKNKGEYVTGEAYLLFKGAQNDIINIEENITGNIYPLKEKSHMICYHAAQAAEKMLKGFIRDKDKTINIKKLHDLDYLYGIALNIDNNFKNMKENCGRLNNYTSWLRYEPEFDIEKHEVIDVLKALKNIYEFSIIKETREMLDEKNKFNILSENCIENIVNIATGKEKE